MNMFKSKLTRGKLQTILEESDLNVMDVYWSVIKAYETKFKKNQIPIPENMNSLIQGIKKSYLDGVSACELLQKDPSITKLAISRMNDYILVNVIEGIAIARIKSEILESANE